MLGPGESFWYLGGKLSGALFKLLVHFACARPLFKTFQAACSRSFEQASEQARFFELLACTGLVRVVRHLRFLLVQPCSEFR